MAQNYPQQTNNPFQTFPWMAYLFPQSAGSLYAGNPFLNMYTPAPNPSALTLSSVMPPAGPSGMGIPGSPPPTSATLTPQAAAPGVAPGGQMTPPSAAGTVPGSPGAGATGLPVPPAPPLPPAQYVAGQQAGGAGGGAGGPAAPGAAPLGQPFQQGILQSLGYQAGPAAYYPAMSQTPINLSQYMFPTTGQGQVYDTQTGQFVQNWLQSAPQAAAGAVGSPLPGAQRGPTQQK